MAADMQIAAEIVAKNSTAAGLTAAAGDVKSAAKEIASSLGEANTAAREAGSIHEMVADKLREHGRELRGTSKLAKIVARDLAMLGVDAKGAGKEIGMFVGAFGLGGGLGLAFEAVKYIAHAFTEASEAEKKATEQLTEYRDETAKLKAETAGLWDKLFGVTEADKKARDLAATQEKLLAVQREISSLQKEMGEHYDTDDSGVERAGNVQRQRQIDQLLEKQEAYSARVKELATQESVLRAEEDKKAALRTEEAQAKQSAAANKVIDKDLAKEKAAREKALAERERLDEQFRQKDIAATAWVEKEKQKGLEDAAKRAKKIIEQQEAEEEAARQQDHEELVAALREQLEEYRGNGAMRIQILKAIAAEEAKVYGDTSKQAMKATKDITKEVHTQAKEQLQELSSVAQKMGSSIGSAFIDMATHAKTFGQAVADVAKQVVQLVVQMVIKSVTAKAADAAAGAAESQAGIPIIGPALAIGAMSAMLAAVMGLLGGVTSSSGGYEVPGNVSSALGVLHPDETVLTADLSKGLKEMIRGGGARSSGGQTIHFHISALDPRGVYRTLKDSESDVMRFLREATAGGR